MSDHLIEIVKQLQDQLLQQKKQQTKQQDLIDQLQHEKNNVIELKTQLKLQQKQINHILRQEPRQEPRQELRQEQVKKTNFKQKKITIKNIQIMKKKKKLLHITKKKPALCLNKYAIFPNQREAASDVVEHFLEGNQHVLIVSETQVGKTGACIAVAIEMYQKNLIDKIVYLCGMSDNPLKFQVIDDFGNVFEYKQLIVCFQKI